MSELSNDIIEKRAAYLEWVKKYCNNPFSDEIPKIVDIVINEMIAIDEKDNVVIEEKLGDYAEKYSDTKGAYPAKILMKLSPYIIKVDKKNYLRWY